MDAERVRELLAEATPGPWIKSRFNVVDLPAKRTTFAVVHTDERDAWSVMDGATALIAAAPDIAAWALEQHERASRLEAENAEFPEAGRDDATA